MTEEAPSRRWRDVAAAAAEDGDHYAEEYAERFRQLAAEGADVHGEAALVAALVPPPATVLDAGCGTGRVGVRLAELGYDLVGCDVDSAMVDVARAEAPDLDWRVADLATLGLGARFDVVLLAGNVVPLLEEGTLATTLARVVDHLAEGGVALLGFGTDEDHLPDGCPVTDLDDVVAAAATAGLVESDRWGTWARDPWDAAGGYVVLALSLTR